MASSAMDTLKGLLGDNADEKIKGILNSLSNNTPQNEQAVDSAPTQPATQSNANNVLNALSGSVDSSTLDSIAQIRDLVSNITNSSNDSRSNLLMSLRPYMRTSRQGSIDTAIRMLNITKLTGIFRLR